MAPGEGMANWTAGVLDHMEAHRHPDTHTPSAWPGRRSPAIAGLVSEETELLPQTDVPDPPATGRLHEGELVRLSPELHIDGGRPNLGDQRLVVATVL